MDFNREENFAAFVTKKVDYYLGKWELFENSSEKISWNWSAFLFSTYWMIYRRMYIPAIAVFAASRIVKYVIALSGGRAYRLTTILFSVAIGMLGNYIYYAYTSSKIADVADTASTDDPAIIGRTLREIGGTSWLWVFLLAFVGGAIDTLLKKALFNRAVSLENFDADTIWDVL
ncbi:MAG: DUF2628 domain-containing protein [Candidatus Kapaibacterium sp.]|nr:MAG: DUF2628 domain-containing protein [Candidatus Kapabacteria bacterium]